MVVVRNGPVSDVESQGRSKDIEATNKTGFPYKFEFFSTHTPPSFCYAFLLLCFPISENNFSFGYILPGPSENGKTALELLGRNREKSSKVLFIYHERTAYKSFLDQRCLKAYTVELYSTTFGLNC